MALSPHSEVTYLQGKPPLPPSTLKRLQSLKEARKVAPVVQQVDVIDADTLTTTTVSASPPDSLSSPPASELPHPLLDCSSPCTVPPCPPAPKFSVQPCKASVNVPSHNLRVCSAGLRVPGEVVQAWNSMFTQAVGADVAISTDDGGSFPAHSHVLAASSPVWQALFKHKPSRRCRHAVLIPGVPYDSARAFIRFVYSSRLEEEDMQKYVLHLLVLSHAYCISALKRICVQHLKQGLLNMDNVTDVLQLARLCDAPRLNLICMQFIVSNFKLVARSEGWKAMRDSDPSLEQELVEAVIEVDSKKQERSRKAEDDKVYTQLHEAMAALVHICKDGCRTIGPYDKASDAKKHSTCDRPACKGLESLVRHFAACKLKVSGGCTHCKRMWQLLELHARMCQETTLCKVPLCSHFKSRICLHSNRKEETRWKLLVSKVAAAKGVASAFSLAAVSARCSVGENDSDLVHNTITAADELHNTNMESDT